MTLYGSLPETTLAPQPTEIDVLRSLIGRAIAACLDGFSVHSGRPDSTEPREDFSPVQFADRIFDVLIHRRYGYLGRSRAEPYRPSFRAVVQEDLRHRQPIHFSYDIGPGYHASLQPGEEGLCFEVGLSELFLLGQIHAFVQEVSGIHSPGCRFHLVIDNLCGLETNDVPLEQSASYCAKLRELIHELGLGQEIDLLVESELPATPDSGPCRPDPRTPAPAVSEADRENVERFLGRPCSHEEALTRIVRYRDATKRTEERLAPFIRGFRMTQRATETTIGFRSFPGGDARIQCGQVAYRRHKGELIQPFLLTSRNLSAFACHRMSFPELLPEMIQSVIFAEPVS